MSVENVKKFYEAVSQDESLKQKFMELSQKYQGQPMDEEKMKLITEGEVLAIAKQAGYPFVFADLITYERETQQAKMGSELSEEELQAVVGGATEMECFILGFGYGGRQGFCIIWGYSDGYQICSTSGYMRTG